MISPSKETEKNNFLCLVDLHKGEENKINLNSDDLGPWNKGKVCLLGIHALLLYCESFLANQPSPGVNISYFAP